MAGDNAAGPGSALDVERADIIRVARATIATAANRPLASSGPHRRVGAKLDTDEPDGTPGREDGRPAR